MKTYTIEEIKAYMEGGLLMKSACLENRMLENLIGEIDDSEDGIEYFTERRKVPKTTEELDNGR